MKIRFYSILLPLFFLFGLTLSAEAVSYQPNWKIGDTATYKTVISADYGSSIDPKMEPVEMPVGELSFTSTYEVINQDYNSTEFAVTFSDFKVSPFYLSAPKTTHYTIYYKINLQGQITQITHLDKWLDAFEKLSLDIGEKMPPTDEEKLVAMIWLNVVVNYSNYSSLPLSMYHGPHHSLYLGKTFPNGQIQDNPIKIHYAPFFPLTFHDIDLVLPGTTTAKESTEGQLFSSIHPINKDTIWGWSQMILDRALLTEEERKKWGENISNYKKNKDLTFSGTFVDTLKTSANSSKVDSSEIIFTYQGSYQGNRYDATTEKMEPKITRYLGNIKIKTTAFTPGGISNPDNPQEKTFQINTN